jgi:hypothetical protein
MYVAELAYNSSFVEDVATTTALTTPWEWPVAPFRLSIMSDCVKPISAIQAT